VLPEPHDRAVVDVSPVAESSQVVARLVKRH
jgi:hypothetical protein